MCVCVCVCVCVCHTYLPCIYLHTLPTYTLTHLHISTSPTYLDIYLDTQLTNWSHKCHNVKRKTQNVKQNKNKPGSCAIVGCWCSWCWYVVIRLLVVKKQLRWYLPPFRPSVRAYTSITSIPNLKAQCLIIPFSPR